MGAKSDDVSVAQLKKGATRGASFVIVFGAGRIIVCVKNSGMQDRQRTLANHIGTHMLQRYDCDNFSLDEKEINSV